jgi:hypothetical protein
VLQESCIKTFEEFRTIDITDVRNFTIKGAGTSPTKLHVNLVKVTQRAVTHCRHKEDLNDIESDSNSPTVWDYDVYSKWTRNGYNNYLNKTTAAATASTVTALGAGTTTILSTAQKDDEAALISWNRKPHDIAKYPFLKNDADYQDWKLKMKRQLISDTLSRVIEPTFTLATCRAGTDHELAMLQINFFEQILCAVLLNPEGNGLVTTHPKARC